MKGTSCKVSLVCLCILDSSQLGCQLLVFASSLAYNDVFPRQKKKTLRKLLTGDQCGVCKAFCFVTNV